MQQLPLPLMPRAEGRFESFLPGDNGPALALLQAECPPRTPHFLWGDAGAGKTHLLQALAARCRAGGALVDWFTPATPLPWIFTPGTALLVFDDADGFGPAQQQAAFALCVEAQSHGASWAAAAAMPPVDLPLREDLRTRLGWGQVHALHALDEAQTRAALQSEAERRGIALSPEVLNYLMSRFSRDLASLMRLLVALDSYSLSRGRAITVPLLRAMGTDGPPVWPADDPGDGLAGQQSGDGPTDAPPAAQPAADPSCD